MATVPFTATYNTAGTYTWTCPPGVTSVTVECTGAGGGGGAAGGTAGSNGGGGGGGEAAAEPSVAVTPGTGYTVVVGAGGAGGTLGGSGADGGDSSFAGDTLTPAGHGGQGGSAGVGGSGQHGAGGTGSVDAVSADGGPGDDGTVSTNGGGGGGAAGASTTTGFPGNAGSGSTAGGASSGTWPGGAGGAGSTSGAGPGSAGSGPGGGGGGALSTGTGRAGGAGADGQVVITWSATDPITLTADTTGGAWKFTAPAGATAVQAQAWGGGAGGFNTSGGGASGVGGSSAFTTIYGSPRQTAAATFDGYVNRPMALAAQVVYYAEGQYPASPDDLQAFGTLVGMGCRVAATFRPSRQAAVTGGAALAAEQAAFAAGLAVLQAVPGAVFYVCIGNEPNINGKHGPFGDGQQENWKKNLPSPYGAVGTVSDTQAAANYLAYHAAYAPTVAAAGLQVAYKPALSSSGTTLTFFPGYGSAAGGCDIVLADWYAADFIPNPGSNKAPIDLFGSSNLEGLADAGGLPLGIGEWGAAGGSTGPGASDYNNIWIPHFAGGFQNRLNAGKPVWDIIYFGGINAGGANVITGPSDFKVPGCQQIYDLLASSGQTGGAGGGGGEYAAEAALAITSGHQYALVVGAGGGGKASGASSTVAGDSVTVTAHGGSVATSASAGGAGGTGSGNTTHHNGGAGGAGGTGGGGGGGSGGTAAAGNAGAAGGSNFGGPGGTAVTGGGPGGKGGGPNANGGGPASGPGGGGGARGAAGTSNGPGFDGQVTLSNFTISAGNSGNATMPGLTASGTATVQGGNVTLPGLTASATATVAGFTQVQNGATASGTGGTLTLPFSASTKGTLLVAVIAMANQAGTTGSPSGWVLAKAQNSGGTSGRTEVWYYPGNPGSLTSAAWTYASGDTRGHVAEYSTPSGFTQALDGTPGSASSATPATSLPVSTASSSAAGDLGIAAFEAAYSPSQSGSWTTPAGWTLNRAQFTGETNSWSSYYKTGLASGTQSVTGTVPTSTSQTGLGAALVVFKAFGVNTTAGAAALSPLTASAAGSSIVPAGTIAADGNVTLAPLTAQSPSTATTFPAAPLPVMVEILINGSWADITPYVYQRDGITIGARGRPNEASTAQPAQVTLTLNNQDGSFSPQNTAGQFYPYLVRNTQMRISVAGAVTAAGANYTGYRFWGQVPAWPPQWDPTGTDVYVQLTAAGALQRMLQSKYSASPIARYYTNIMNQQLGSTPGNVPIGVGLVPAGYWPCEDGNNAGSFASGIPGGSPMTWTGTPSLAAGQDVPGSAPFAQLAGSVWTGTPGAYSSGGITYSTPGTYEWVCPGGVTSVQAECWGGGGGGANGVFGQGGGGGEYAAEAAVAVTPGKSYTVVVGASGPGGAGSFKGNTNGIKGGDGFRSTFSGDSVTVTAHGGQGGRTTVGNAAAGGTGSSNSTHHDGGAGAVDHLGAGFGGNGGGASGGLTHQGGAGVSGSSNAGGAGGTAVTGGGPGGAGGHGYNGGAAQATRGLMPSPGPGGGGGGGGFNNFTGYGWAGGGGQPGQVRLTFGTTSQPPAVVLRVLIDVPSTGGTDSANLAQITTSGGIGTLSLIYHTGGNLELIAKSGATTLFDSGSIAFGCNGQPMLVSCELVQSGANVKWKLTALAPGASAVVATKSGTLSSSTLGSVTQVNVNNAAGHTDTLTTGVGHVSVQYAVDPILNLSQALNAYIGELAAARFLRLCLEQNVPVEITGNITDTPAMGPQPADLLVNLLQDCENTDLGQMFERRDAFGLGYRTRVSLQNQAAVTLDYSLAQLAQGLVPTNDDQLVRNDVIAIRGSGGTTFGTFYEAIATLGTLSVNDPPNGAGLYQYQVTVNVQADSQLPAFAAWLLTLGTLDEYRYPSIVIDLARAEVSDGTFSAVPALDIGDQVTINNPPAWLPQYPINQLCYGFTETINAYQWTITINAVPADPYIGTQNPFPAW